jgi:low temperature requirement protein LtrA
MEGHPDTGGEESEKERLDRNLTELLGELRVALPGVQVLFAFLLVVPFNPRFPQVSAFQEKLYFGTLLCSAAATAFLIAPTVQHRITFRQQDRPHLVERSNLLAIIGLGFLAVAMTGAIVLVTDFLFGPATTVVAAIVVGGMFAALWYAIPVRRRLQITR